MATTTPTPVSTGTATTTVSGPPSRGPAAVAPGPGTTGTVVTAPVPIGPPETAPPAVTPGPGTGQTTQTTATVTVPVTEVPVDTAGGGGGNTVVIGAVPNYIEVLADGTIIVQNATALNFTGTGVSITANGAVATLTISSGGTLSKIENGTSYANIPTANGNVTISSAGQIWTFATNGTLSAAGNITTTANISGSYILGNGSQLTGITSSYGNANVAANLAAFGSNPISTSGNITGGNIINSGISTVTGNITGGNLLTGGLISATGNITGGNLSGTSIVGTLTTATQTNITSVGTLGSLTVTANVTGGNLLTGGLISATGNITGGNILGGANVNATTHTGTTVSVSANVTGGNILTGGLISATGNVTANNISLTGNGFVSFTSGSTLTFGDTPVTNRYYVDATRTDTYTQNGSQSKPFKTIAAAQAAIATAIAGGLNPEVEPIYIILLSNITENVTLATNHVYLVGQNGQIHQPIILTGNVVVQPTAGTLNNNHFSISGIEVVGGTDGKAIYVTGTFPTRLSLQDMWITANGNSGAGLYQDNTGTGTYTHGGPIKVSHNGTGNVYCFDIRKGTASFESVETSGATQVGAAGPGATLTFNNSQLDANGDVVVETYGNGVVVVTNSVIKNSAANSYGIKLNAVANVAGTVSVGQSAFNVPLGTGQAVWLDPNATPGLSGVFAWSGASFYPNTNTTIAPLAIPGPLPVLVGTIASPILYGDITSYSVAQDWDLIDNNASALSFDTTGKAGVLELVTTNSAEGVKMSGYVSVTGNVTGGNLSAVNLVINNIRSDDSSFVNIEDGVNVTGAVDVSGNITGGNLNVTGLSLSGNVVSALNASSSIAAGTTISAVGNITGGNLITGALTSTAGLSVTGNTATITTANYSVGYLNIPQISFAANATAALVDSGKHYYSTSASNLALTLADNSAVSWPVGTALSVINRGTANVTVAPAAGVSLYLAGNSTSANRTVTTYGMATVMNVAANIWMINGTVV